MNDNFFARRRQELGCTQRSIALKLGMTDKAVSSWERSETFPRRVTLARVAAAYGVPLSRLLDEIAKHQVGGRA